MCVHTKKELCYCKDIMKRNPKRIVLGLGYPEFIAAGELSYTDNTVKLLNKTRELVWKLHHPRISKADRYRLVLELVDEPEVLPNEPGYKPLSKEK